MANRRRTKRDSGGTPSPWVEQYLKTGKELKEGDEGYDEFCAYTLLRLNVVGLPEYPELNGKGYYQKPKKA